MPRGSYGRVRHRGRHEFDTAPLGAADIATGAVDTAELAADAVDGTKIADNAVDSEHITAGAVDTAHIADDQVTNAKLGPENVKTLKFQYDFADLGGAQGAITLTDDADAALTIPDNAVIVGARYEAITSMTSGGAATAALGFTGNTDAFIAATAYNNGEFDAGTVTALTAEVPIKTTAAVSVLLTIATADLTAGKGNVWIDFVEGDA